MDLSIVIPVYNEEESIGVLIKEIEQSISELNYEIITINDGSADNTLNVLKDMKKGIKEDSKFELVIVNLRRNTGQTAAMRAGFDIAKGKYIVTMDGDGQNDPADIPKLYEKITHEEVDVVCGWRKDRNDPLSKKIPSKLSNFLHRRLTGLKINDSGCTLRIYGAEAVKDLPIHGEDHRFLPSIIHSRGFKITQMVVNHRHREAGISKYGFSRLWRGYLDLIATTFTNRIGVKPLQFYSKIAIIPFVIGTGILLFLAYLKLIDGEDIGDRPILLLGVLLEIFAIQFFVTGLTADLISTSRAADHKRYSVRDIF